MNALTPTDAASCRAMAVECGRRANALRLTGDAAGAMAQLDRSRELCLLALRFEQEEQTSARGSLSNAEGAGGVSPPAPLASKSNSAGDAPERFQPASDRNGASTENGDVDGSASRAGHAGQTMYALSGQVETRNSDVDTLDGNASLAAREGEKPLHSNSEFGSRAETHNSHHVGRVSNAQCQGAVAAQASNPHSLQPLAANGPAHPKPTPASGQPHSLKGAA